ncbi:ABC transporter substrate-binding protein [Ochrobactrum pseudogrignonense]|nr:ABC transporter substrate-binding protein [Brucella pseudogrignonensis]
MYYERLFVGVNGFSVSLGGYRSTESLSLHCKMREYFVADRKIDKYCKQQSIVFCLTPVLPGKTESLWEDLHFETQFFLWAYHRGRTDPVRHAGLTARTELVEAARKEGSVTIYSATDRPRPGGSRRLCQKYPDIRVDYNDIGTNGVYNRVISEAAAGQVGGDLFWTSAMDQGVKLAVDGYLAPYQSTETAALPVGPYIRTSSTQPRSNRSA